MKLRYDFNASQKTYRTFPQKVVQSTGLLDRWSFLKWCCPFCLEKPSPQSRKSSVPVIRITRPRSPDSDLDSDEDEDLRRRGSVSSAGSIGSGGSLSRSQRGITGKECDASADVISLESSLGSGDLDIINEEMDDEAKDYDSESIESKESIRSKTSSVHSKASTIAKDKSSSKSRISWKSKDKSSCGDSKDSRKSSSKESLKSKDSGKEKDQSEKTRSPMKKLIKHLKRTPSSPTNISRGDKRSASTRSSTSLEDGGSKGGKTGSKKFSFTSGSEWRTRSSTVDNRIQRVGRDEKIHKSATGEVVGKGVMIAKNNASSMKSETLANVKEKDTPESNVVFETVKLSNANQNAKVDEVLTGNSHPLSDTKVKGNQDGRIFSHPTDGIDKRKEVDRNEENTKYPPSPFSEKVSDTMIDDDNEDEEEEILSNCGQKSFRKDSGRDTESEIGQGEIDGPFIEEEVVFKKSQRNDQRGRGRKDNGKDREKRHGWINNQRYENEVEDGGGETTESSPPETPAATKEQVYDSSSTKPSSGFEDESTGSLEDGLGGHKSGSPSPLVGSVGRTSGRESVASLASSTDNSTVTHPDEDIERLMMLSEKKRNSLTPLGSRSESMASVCSAGAEGRYGTVIIKGEIELGLQYNYKEGQLECHIVQCRELAAVDNKRNRSDPYVKVYLLPDKSKSGKRKTKVKKHTLNPVFEEVLRFSTTMSELDSRTLWVSVWHSDMFGRNDFLGEVIIALADTVFDDVTPKWYPLQDRTEPMEDLSYSPRGDLIIALKFVPPDAVSSRKSTRRSRGALHVLVKEAKSLAAVRPHGTADPVCKGLLLPEKGKASKQKTSVCRKTLNPTWNHTLVFEDTSLQELTERSLELSVWDHDRLGSSQFLGGCRLNLGKGKHAGRLVEWMEAAGMEVKLWEQMLERPNLWVEGSIMLRPTMDKPIYSSSMTE